MTVETNANFIGDLNEAYPTQRDLINEGDDHIRLVKAVLKKTFPGMDKAVTLTSDKMNQLDQTLVYGEEGVLKINNSLELKEGSTTNFGGSVLSNIGDPKEPQDAINLRSLQGSLMWPIGSIYMSIDARNPEAIFGFGKWEKFAEGRVILGSGSATDINNTSKIFANEEKGGEFSHPLKVEELPAHSHSLEGARTKTDGAHKHAFRQLSITPPSPDTKHDGNMAQYDMVTYYTEVDGAHSHEVEGTTANAGGGTKMSLIQPYAACNIWVRKE